MPWHARTWHPTVLWWHSTVLGWHSTTFLVWRWRHATNFCFFGPNILNAKWHATASNGRRKTSHAKGSHLLGYRWMPSCCCFSVWSMPNHHLANYILKMKQNPHFGFELLVATNNHFLASHLFGDVKLRISRRNIFQEKPTVATMIWPNSSWKSSTTLILFLNF